MKTKGKDKTQRISKLSSENEEERGPGPVGTQRAGSRSGQERRGRQRNFNGEVGLTRVVRGTTKVRFPSLNSFSLHKISGRS